ncbi:hypothetical protein NDU88_001383 [Pleurodeles waltl]|uniref:A-kinase anchor protein 2 C-terminal domain-containing protein n=1 Tax=Pleurodeles waltl TaxID=8319 RepID=A0AAV7SCT6_PLEWA|nr:hypothetical protein NDU88_001383 [Pleurodeles waltl]
MSQSDPAGMDAHLTQERCSGEMPSAGHASHCPKKGDVAGSVATEQTEAEREPSCTVSKTLCSGCQGETLPGTICRHCKAGSEGAPCLKEHVEGPDNSCDAGEGNQDPNRTFQDDIQREGYANANHEHQDGTHQEGHQDASFGCYDKTQETPQDSSTASLGDTQTEVRPDASTGCYDASQQIESTGSHDDTQREGPVAPSIPPHDNTEGGHSDASIDLCGVTQLRDSLPSCYDDTQSEVSSDTSHMCPGVTDDDVAGSAKGEASSHTDSGEASPAGAPSLQQGEGAAFPASAQAPSPGATTCSTQPGSGDGAWGGAVAQGLDVSSAGGARRDNREQGAAAPPDSPQEPQVPGRALPAEPANQSRQPERAELGAPATSQEAGPPATTQKKEATAASQESGTPTESQGTGAPTIAGQEISVTTTNQEEQQAKGQEIGAQTTASQETGAELTKAGIDSASTGQSLGTIYTRKEITPETTLQGTSGPSASSGTSDPSTVDIFNTDPSVKDTTSCSTAEAITACATAEGSTAPTNPKDLAAPSVGSHKTKGPMEVEQDDYMSDSGVSADFSPGSTLEMDVEPTNETPIEREIRRHAEREEMLRKERGIPSAADHQQYVEVKMKPILSRAPADTLLPKEKERQRAGAQMQREIRIESQREEDLVQLGKVMGAYDRGLAQELHQKKMVFEQKAETSAVDLASLKKLNRPSYGEAEPPNQASGRGAEPIPRQGTSPVAMAQHRGNWEKKGPSYAEANGSNVIILDYNVLLHQAPSGREQPAHKQGSSMGPSQSNDSHSMTNGLPGTTIVSTSGPHLRTINVPQNSSNSTQPGIANFSVNASQHASNLGPSNLTSGSSLNPPSPRADQTIQENPFFRLRSKSPQSLLEQEIREVQERESELRRMRRSLYGGQVTEDTSSPAHEPFTEPESDSGQAERPYSGKLEVTWPPRSSGTEVEQEGRTSSMMRQKSPLVQRWETGMVSSQQSQDEEE